MSEMTCGTCGAEWDDREIPTPAGRCPWEYDHAEFAEDDAS